MIELVNSQIIPYWTPHYMTLGKKLACYQSGTNLGTSIDLYVS